MSGTRWCQDDVLTVDQVAERLQVDPRCVYRMNLPRLRVGKENRYIWGEVLDGLPRAGGQPAAPPTGSASSGRGLVHEFRRQRGAR
jgi:hypothetical protein